MKKLLLFTVTLLLMTCTPVFASNASQVKATIVKYSIEMGVDPAITLSIAKLESGYRQEARSPRGAVGVFQLMPSTARRMGLNPYTLEGNVKGGIMYYKSMYKMFGSMELALAAYNAGPGNVKKYRAIPPFKETRRYVTRIMSEYNNLKAHPDPIIASVKNGTYILSANGSVQAVSGAQIIGVGSKSAPLPMAKIEQARNLNAELIKEIPMEVEVKTQSVAI